MLLQNCLIYIFPSASLRASIHPRGKPRGILPGNIKTMEKFEEPKFIRREKIKEYEKTEEYITAKVGGDSRPHKYRARYRIQEYRAEYESPTDGSRYFKNEQKRELIENTLENLGPVGETVPKAGGRTEDKELPKAA